MAPTRRPVACSCSRTEITIARLLVSNAPKPSSIKRLSTLTPLPEDMLARPSAKARLTRNPSPEWDKTQTSYFSSDSRVEGFRFVVEFVIKNGHTLGNFVKESIFFLEPNLSSGGGTSPPKRIFAG